MPYVSTYSDCREETFCRACRKCTCSAEATWVCKTDRTCEPEKSEDEIEEANMNAAMEFLASDLSEKKKKDNNDYSFVPKPQENVLDKEDVQYEDAAPGDLDRDELMRLLRMKRSVKDNDSNEGNGTVKFHHTIDEVNEDTLKNVNTSGTLKATKMDLIPKGSRRSTSSNNATSKSLQIEYTPPIVNQHVGDNKVDTPALHDDQEDLLIHHKIYEIVGNQSQSIRDKDLSKLLVNEMKGGAEIIGDQNSPPISNITFTFDNDTLTAMAFIAGNLLSKLWNMEKDPSDNSLETENIKHQKINELLELFKNPLSLRQETFLKNALEQLSTAVENKDIENISICKNIEKLKNTSGLIDEPVQSNQQKESKPIIPEKGNLNKLDATAEALTKITNVLDLLTKYERVQNNLSDLKSNFSIEPAIRTSSDKDLTKNDKNTLNVFGKTLETLTKLLLPKKKSKKMITSMKKRNYFTSDQDFTDKIKSLNLTDMSVTAKDRIVLDYLTHIQNSPKCLISKQQETSMVSNIEGDILLNLSEFLKIKSISDLIKLVEPEKPSRERENVMRSMQTTTEITKSEVTTTTETDTQTTDNDGLTKFKATKQKLKTHLRTILEDLLELQNISGKSMKGKGIDIAEALPCIYNLLNTNRDKIETKTNKSFQTIPTIIEKPNKVALDPVKKVTEIFNNLNRELKNTKAQTRRTNVRSGQRPKSAIVWERTIKNLNTKSNSKNRRNLGDEEPKSYENIKKIIDVVENSGSNTYKSIAYFTDVPAAERLMLLKTIALDTKKYVNSLKVIKQWMETVATLPIDQRNTIAEFVDNVDINVNLNEKILAKLEKSTKDLYLLKKEIVPNKTVKIYKSTEFGTIPPTETTVKLRRDQIINQLIKNRMQSYLKLKDATGDQDINLDLAKRILMYLEMGNDNLARELYKLFVSESKKQAMVSSRSFFSQGSDPVKYETINQQRMTGIANKIPLIQFEEPKTSVLFEEPKTLIKEISWSNQNQLIKQLANIKNMKV